MILTRGDMRAINRIIKINIKEMYGEITKRNSSVGLTYNELSENIAEISGDDYKREFKIERLE